MEVDLSKPLLAMFMIKRRKYNVEYEGLHVLCINCGRFAHYVEGCPDKGIVNLEEQARFGIIGLETPSNENLLGGSKKESKIKLVLRWPEE